MVELELVEGVLLVQVSNPPVNALSQVERQGLLDAMAAAQADDVVAVVIAGAIAGGGRNFIAGADVREFGQPPLPPHLPQVIDAIEACPKPVVAAIQGAALGGGLEVALGCHYRVAAKSAKLGLPEVTLGVVPGAGGTQRLPRLIDPAEAARIIAGGKPVSADKATQLGLVDQVIEGDPLPAALDFARGLAGRDVQDRRLSCRAARGGIDDQAAWDKLAAEIKRAARGAKAPLVALELAELAQVTPFAEGVAKEREQFLALRGSEEAAALRHIFFAEKAAAKLPEDCATAQVRPISHVGVIGAGTMGTGIAISVADGGYRVTLVEVSPEALQRGLGNVAKSYADSVAKGRLAPTVAQERQARITGSTDYTALADCDLIIEAAFEDMGVKREILGKLQNVAKAGAILATNTSYLDLDEIACASGRPQDVVGLHYFSPANIMKLLEVVRGAQTSPTVLASAMQFARSTGKVAVVAGVCHGFIGNRMLRAYNREAGLLLLEGASPEQIDGALTRFGMAMGPFAVADLSGIDIGYKARAVMPEGSFEPLAFAIHDALVERGDLGRKSGAGFYLYEAGSRATVVNPALQSLLDVARAKAGVTARAIDDAEIVERTMLALANEGGFILSEGIAAREGDIDTAYVHGYGFPRHRGGPMFYARQCGLASVRDRIEAMAIGRFGRWWPVAPIFAQA
ncbi:3-hydroxyacyl-CoA dehydrogenase [Novosphingobium umbonatum]|uniref:3-hydroxyacyl-CoA dehydrogenase n=1 Tax=Novosphingobium umbonatum TaxID=1908524 RepID=A0A3S2Y4E4_9SPHN|nr:3-hydroxyacyl-CoA dehydrogenase NAD-binding domain-containing protein [Novosphingobium umbonatum]RVU03216.1 3-hydroxyacyl-CoA dehydrogenase [Novosphingobium umbonatum]